MSSLGSQGSMNQGKLDKQPSKAPEKSQENIRPDDSLIPAGSISSDSTNQKLEPVGSDSAACSVDRIQSYIKNKCPDVYRYSSSIADYTDTRTKLCVEEIGIDPDRSCSTLESDFERLKNCEVFCNLICLPGKNRPENSEILPDDCKVPTTPVTKNTSPISTTKVTTSTTTNAATESDSGNTLAIGLGAGLGGLLLIVLVILGIYCFKNRKRAPKVPERPLPRIPDDNASGDYANPYQIEPDNGAYINEEVYETYGDAHIDQMKPLPGRSSEYVNSKYLKTVDTPHSVYYVTKK